MNLIQEKFEKEILILLLKDPLLHQHLHSKLAVVAYPNHIYNQEEFDNGDRQVLISNFYFYFIIAQVSMTN